MKSDENLAVAKQLFEAFSMRDAQGMSACYGEGIVFEDPVFGELHGEEVHEMWAMLIGRGKDLQVKLIEVRESDSPDWLLATWEASYTFSKTGKFVVNRVQSRLRMSGGKIVEQRDKFSLWNWSKQALGTAGYVLGWSKVIKNKLNSEARKGLKTHMEQKGIKGDGR